MATVAAAFASLATSSDCGRTLRNDGQSLLTPASQATVQRFRAIVPPPSTFKVNLEVRSSSGASVRAALVVDDPALFSRDAGPIPNTEIVLAQDSSEPATGSITLPPCVAPGCGDYRVALELESASGIEADVRWAIRVENSECRSDDEYMELRRE
jgi:hypothetical protein